MINLDILGSSLFPFCYPTFISSFKMIPPFCSPFLLSRFYIDSILSLSVSNFVFQIHSIYYQTTCWKYCFTILEFYSLVSVKVPLVHKSLFSEKWANPNPQSSPCVWTIQPYCLALLTGLELGTSSKTSHRLTFGLFFSQRIMRAKLRPSLLR